MRSRPFLIAILIALVPAALAIGGFARYVRGRELASGVRRGSEVAALDPAQVVSVEITVGARSVRATRDGAGWRGADPAAVQAALERLAALRRRGTLARAETLREELEAYGLVRPRARISVTLADGRALAWAIGDGTGRDGAAFLLAPDETVVIATQADVAALERSLAGLAGAAAPGASRLERPDIPTPALAPSPARQER
jgi:hypothetical protein